MLRKAAIVGGIILTIVGLVGLAPLLFTEDNATAFVVFGTFLISGEHSPLYLVTAACAFIAAKSEQWATWFFRIFGFVYGVAAIYGFATSDSTLGASNLNTTDEFVHLAIGLASLILGFMAGDTSSPQPLQSQTTHKNRTPKGRYT